MPCLVDSAIGALADQFIDVDLVVSYLFARLVWELIRIVISSFAPLLLILLDLFAHVACFPFFFHHYFDL